VAHPRESSTPPAIFLPMPAPNRNSQIPAADVLFFRGSAVSRYTPRMPPSLAGKKATDCLMRQRDDASYRSPATSCGSRVAGPTTSHLLYRIHVSRVFHHSEQYSSFTPRTRAPDERTRSLPWLHNIRKGLRPTDRPTDLPQTATDVVLSCLCVH